MAVGTEPRKSNRWGKFDSSTWEGRELEEERKERQHRTDASIFELGIADNKILHALVAMDTEELRRALHPTVTHS